MFRTRVAPENKAAALEKFLKRKRCPIFALLMMLQSGLHAVIKTPKPCHCVKPADAQTFSIIHSPHPGLLRGPEPDMLPFAQDSFASFGFQNCIMRLMRFALEALGFFSLSPSIVTSIESLLRSP